jgi:hypothetical protein
MPRSLTSPKSRGADAFEVGDDVDEDEEPMVCNTLERGLHGRAMRSTS